jgi:glycosyltransferase involved in cell wall biosynthesis
MKVSIVVPAYEMKGNGAEFLGQLISSVIGQTYKNVEVVVSDDSKDGVIQELCRQASEYLKVIHVKHESQGRSSPNVNNAIDHASGDIIKVLFQDDFFVDKEAITKIVREHENGHRWVLAGYVHTNDGVSFYKHHIPSFHPEGYVGENLVGAPSCLSFIRDEIRFDDKLAWLMDCEFYHRLYLKWGKPKIIPDPLSANRLWNGQVTNDVDEGVKAFETCYVWRKFND